MAGLIPQAFVDDLLERVDIVDVIDSSIKLKKSGKNYQACCPFHDEKTPSFTVSPEKQFYYCFGCGANGNALGFIINHERLGFPEAVKRLADRCGLDVPTEATESPKTRQRKKLYELLKKSSDYFCLQLKGHASRQLATQYLTQRGLSGAVTHDYHIGYAPPGWDNLLNALGESTEDSQLLVEAGMVIARDDKRQYDRFRQRIMFPIRDVRGRVVGFGGRVLDQSKPKYLNSPETIVFHKAHELYGLYEAKQASHNLPRLLIVEGYMDVVALAQYGIRYAAATLGTACGKDHLELAFRYTSEVIFCFDGDNAGRQAAKRALENSLSVMEDGRQVKFLFLPDGEDPDSLIRQVGAEKFNRRLDLAVPIEDFLFDAISEGIDIRAMEGRARLSKIAAPMLDRLPKGVFRELMFDQLAKRTGLTTSTLYELIKASPPAVKKPASETYQYTSSPPFDDVAQSSIMDEWAASDPGHLTPEPQQPLTTAPRQISLPLEKLAIAVLLHSPSLAALVEKPDRFRLFNDPYLNLFVELVELLHQRPNYTLNRILGYWRGTYGEDSTDKLAKLAAIQLLTNAKLLTDYDPEREFQDILEHFDRRLRRNSQLQHPVLAKAKNSAFNKLSDNDKQQLKEQIEALIKLNASNTHNQDA